MKDVIRVTKVCTIRCSMYVLCDSLFAVGNSRYAVGNSRYAVRCSLVNTETRKHVNTQNPVFILNVSS